MRDEVGLFTLGTQFNRWPARLRRILPFLVCPTCRCEVTEMAGHFHCRACNRDYPIRDGKIYFIEPLEADDALDVIKNKLKKFLGPAYYTVGVTIVAPSFPFSFGKAIRKHVDPAASLVIDVGCGNFRIDEDIVTLDASDYGAVDIIADLQSLPFADGSIDALCSRSALEHVSEIDHAIAELRRCTKPGGFGIHFVPFIYPFHASPHDFSRWTPAGFRRLFGEWQVIEQRGTTGPISLFLIFLLEFLSTLLSFGVPRLKGPIFLVLCLFVFPLKFLDVLFVGRPSFLGLAPTILNVLRKP